MSAMELSDSFRATWADTLDIAWQATLQTYLLQCIRFLHQNKWALSFFQLQRIVEGGKGGRKLRSAVTSQVVRGQMYLSFFKAKQVSQNKSNHLLAFFAFATWLVMAASPVTSSASGSSLKAAVVQFEHVNGNKESNFEKVRNNWNQPNKFEIHNSFMII